MAPRRDLSQWIFAGLLVLAVVALLCGCANLVPRDPVAETLVAEARVPGIDRPRWWRDEVPGRCRCRDQAEPSRYHEACGVAAREGPTRRQLPRPIERGDDGAFAAGVLVGWTRSGRRPRFEIVTGVTAGALIAPFAFLGPAYDKDLESMWTGNASADLITPQPLAVLIGGNALADSQPLANLIAHYVNRRC
jgi:hypothetical protein